MGSYKRAIDIHQPVIWDWVKEVTVPKGLPVSPDAFLALCRLDPSLLLNISDKKKLKDPIKDPAKEYVRRILCAARKKWEKDNDLLTVIQLMDVFPMLIIPDIQKKFSWLTEALILLFTNREYNLFKKLPGIITKGGAPKGDDNAVTFEYYLLIQNLIMKHRVISYVKENGLPEDLIKTEENYLRFLASENFPRKLEYGVAAEAKKVVCFILKISPATFDKRIDRVKRDPMIRAKYEPILKKMREKKKKK